MTKCKWVDEAYGKGNGVKWTCDVEECGDEWAWTGCTWCQWGVDDQYSVEYVWIDGVWR